MFFEKLSDLPKIAKQVSCGIFVIPANSKLKLKNALFITPDPSKKTPLISVEQIRELISISSNKETTNRFFVITPANAMSELAQNTFLKTLEEPHPNCHFLLLTESPDALLPTIRSRAPLFVLRTLRNLTDQPNFSAKTINLAKKLISAKPTELPALATEISKNKTSPRQNALDIVSASIELLYKSYFKTKNPKFLAKIPNFITLHKNISENGHIKLQIVANLW